jgi:hypothetical protein
MTYALALLLSSALSLAAAAPAPAPPQHQLKITDPPPQLVQTGGIAAWRSLVADYDQWAAQNDPMSAGDEGDEAALFRPPPMTPAGRRCSNFKDGLNP